MADLRTLIRAQSGYGSWEYGQSVAPDTLGAALNGATEDVQVSGPVVVGAGSVALATTHSIVGTNVNARFSGAGFAFAFIGTGGGFASVTLDTLPLEFTPTSSAQVITSTHLATGFWGILEGVQMTDVTIGQCAGNLSDRKMRWQGSNNTFLRCSDTYANNKFSSFDAFQAIEKPGYGIGKQKSFTGNRFIACQASAYEEIFGFDCLPVGFGPAVMQVTSVDGNQVGFSVVQNATGYGVTTSAVVGMHVAFLTGGGARRYHPIVGLSGSTYQLGQSRTCKTVYGVKVGDYALMGPVWADNDYEGCTAYVNYELGVPGNQPANDNGWEFPNTAFSMFGMCFGNIIRENVCVRHPNESVPINQLVSGPREDWYEGCNFGRPVYGYIESCFVFLSSSERICLSGFNRVIDNDFGDLTSVMGAGSIRSDTWGSEQYDNVKPPVSSVCGGALLYGGETAFVGNTYPVSDQQIFTLMGEDAYGSRGWFESPQPQRTALQSSKNVVWRGNSSLPNTRWQTHHHLRWWPDQNWNPTNPVRKPVWGVGIPGSTPASPLGGQSETTWSDGSPRATLLDSGEIAVRFYREDSEVLERSVGGGAFTPVGGDIDPTLYLDTDISEGGSYVYRIGTLESEPVWLPLSFDLGGSVIQGIDIGSLTDSGRGGDTVTLNTRIGLQATDTGRASDAVTLGIRIGIPATSTGRGSDLATLGTRIGLTVNDSGVGSDGFTLDTLYPLAFDLGGSVVAPGIDLGAVVSTGGGNDGVTIGAALDPGVLVSSGLGTDAVVIVGSYTYVEPLRGRMSSTDGPRGRMSVSEGVSGRMQGE